MLYHLFQWLTDEGIKFPGSGLFQFITFRALMAVLLSLIITMIYGRRIIGFLQKMQVGESVRELIAEMTVEIAMVIANCL